MNHYNERTFDIPELKGISKKTIEEHLKLYSGYVKNTNLILDKIEELAADSEKNAYALGEIQRRFGFEFNGMRNHEYYFEQFEGGFHDHPENCAIKAKIEKEWGSYDAWLNRFKAIAMTRGIGWAILYYDATADRMVNAWIDEQHLGQLNGLKFVLGLDMWEHSYMLDYVPGEKRKYIDSFFENLNWPKIEERFK